MKKIFLAIMMVMLLVCPAMAATLYTVDQEPAPSIPTNYEIVTGTPGTASVWNDRYYSVDLRLDALEAPPAGVFLSHVVEDSSPQLGGFLDARDFSIVNVGLIDISPTDALAAAATWKGINIDGSALDPAGASSLIYGSYYDFSGVAMTNQPTLEAIRVLMPASYTGEADMCAFEATGNGMVFEVIDNDKGGHGVFLSGGDMFVTRTLPSTAAATFAMYEATADVSSLAATSILHLFNASAVGGGAGEVAALGVNPGVAPVHQHSGTFVTPSQTEYAARFPDGGAWTDGIDGETVFVARDDVIYIGSATMFGALEVLLGTPSGKDAFQTHAFLNDSAAWITFTPDDGTNGFQQNGEIEWDSGNLTDWDSAGDPGGADGSAGYWVKLTRNRVSSLSPNPIVTTIKISAATEYSWDALGNVNALTFRGILKGDGNAVPIDANADTTIDGNWVNDGTYNALLFGTEDDPTQAGARGFRYGTGDLEYNDAGSWSDVGGVAIITEFEGVEINATANTINMHGLKTVDEGSNISGIYASMPVDDGLIFQATYNESIKGWLNTGDEAAGTLTATALKAVWHAETVFDSSGNAHTLTNSGGTFAIGKYGAGVEFKDDGTFDYLTIVTHADFQMGTGSYSFCFWYKATDYDEIGYVFYKQGTDLYRVAIDTTGQAIIWVYDGADEYNLTSTGFGAVDTWTFYGISWDATTETFLHYVRQAGGAAVTNSATNGTPDIDDVSPTGALFIGNPTGTHAEELDGVLDELILHKGIVLTEGQFELIYNNQWRGQTYLDTDNGSGIFITRFTSLGYTVPSTMSKTYGTIDLWFTPAWDGDDGVEHRLFDMETGNAVNQTSIYKNAGNNLYFLTEDAASGVRYVAGAVTSANMPAGTAAHIAGTWDNGQYVIYLNGVSLEDTETGSGDPILVAPTTMYAGRDATGVTNEAMGVFDVLRVYNRALTGDEILQNYNAAREGVK